MNASVTGMESYRLSSQQHGVLVPHWQERAPVHAVLLEGPANGLAPEVLRAALDRLIQRHEVLRLHFNAVVALRHPLQHVAAAGTAAWTVVDGPATDAQLLDTARGGIDLRSGPVVGAALARSLDGRLRWALAASAYNLDATALQALAMACVEDGLRRGNMTADDGDVLQYPDYVAWQDELFAGDLGQEGARYWRGRAGQLEPALRLPFEGETREEAAVATLALTDDANGAVATLANRLSLTPDRVMLGLWTVFMARIAQVDRVSFGWHADVRTEELTGALGCFTANLPISLDLEPGAPIDDVLRSLAGQLDTPWSWKECFDAAAWREGATRPAVEFSPVRLLEGPDGWACIDVDLDAGTAALRCDCIEAQGKYRLRWQGAGVHAPETIQVWLQQFVTLLEASGRQPGVPWSRLPMVGEAERARVARSVLSPRQAAPRAEVATLHGLFEASAARCPDAIAVACGEERVTYRELDLRAGRLAVRLQALGLGPERVVGVHLDRSVDAIAAVLGVLKAGCAYLALDPGYPEDRIDAMVLDAEVSAVITVAQHRARFGGTGAAIITVDDHGAVDTHSPVATAVPGHLAYLIYTSGSTGRAKGVMVSHANAVASTSARFNFYDEPVSGFLLLSSLSFDSSVAGIFWTLGQGGTLHLPGDGVHQDPVRIASLVARERISHLLTLPSFYEQILDHVDGAVALRCAVVAGEACHVAVVEKHRSRVPQAALVNEYGPTEGTVWSNACRIGEAPADGRRIPIGRPVPSMHGRVLDDWLEPCPIGVPGEWFIGGAGITRGYGRQPGLTAQRFIADPHADGQRLYRTGDRVRMRPDGEIEYLGRIDSQVKLRGHRIELGEIEATLQDHEHVREAVVLLHEDPDLGQRLVACVVPHTGNGAPDDAMLQEALGQHLRRRMPAFMVPQGFVVLPHFPLMPNGKIDRRALLALGGQGQRPPHVEPVHEIDRSVAEIWQAVLKVDRVGLDDNFFDLGGHSLLATQVVARIRQALAVDLPLREFFEANTLRDFGARVQAHRDEGFDEVAAMERLLADAESAP